MHSNLFTQMCKKGCRFLQPEVNLLSHLALQGRLKLSKQLLTSLSMLLLLNQKILAKDNASFSIASVFSFPISFGISSFVYPSFHSGPRSGSCLPPPIPAQPEAKAGSAAISSLPLACVASLNNSPSFHYMTKYSFASNGWHRSRFSKDPATSGLLRRNHPPPQNPLCAHPRAGKGTRGVLQLYAKENLPSDHNGLEIGPVHDTAVKQQAGPNHHGLSPAAPAELRNSTAAIT